MVIFPRTKADDGVILEDARVEIRRVKPVSPGHPLSFIGRLLSEVKGMVVGVSFSRR